eukprot:scaffold141506_cov51-Phaeocystis_antarctica.AAC.1
MSVMAETSHSAMGQPHFAVAAIGRALVVKTQAEIAGELGEGSGGLGDGGGAGGDDGGGEGQCFVSHFLNFFSHFVHFFFLLPAASTPFARRSEMRSMIMSFIVWALCVPARQGA